MRFKDEYEFLYEPVENLSWAIRDLGIIPFIGHVMDFIEDDARNDLDSIAQDYIDEQKCDKYKTIKDVLRDEEKISQLIEFKMDIIRKDLLDDLIYDFENFKRDIDYMLEQTKNQ